VYIENEAGTDITVTVQDQEYQAEATVDADADGVDETAVVQRPDGHALAFSDTDGDGQADLMTEIDQHGEVTGQAGYDAVTGDWIGMEPATDHGSRADPMGGSDEQITVDTPDGEIPAGPATYDTDGDGVNDSVVMMTGDGGDTTVFTDVDGDGGADVATEITADGQVTVAEHVGDGEWTVIERGRIGGDGSYQRTDAQAEDGWAEDRWAEDRWAEDTAWAGTDSSISVDPATGQWVRR